MKYIVFKILGFAEDIIVDNNAHRVRVWSSSSSLKTDRLPDSSNFYRVRILTVCRRHCCLPSSITAHEQHRLHSYHGQCDYYPSKIDKLPDS